MQRIPEPELMEDEAQALAYAKADFAEVNQSFVERFCEKFPAVESEAVVDLGCGPADILMRLAELRPQAELVGIDGAEAMLAPGREAIAARGLAGRIDLRCANLPGAADGRRFDAVISNSLLHHLHDPLVLWREIDALAKPGAAIFVMDLERPTTKAQAHEIVATYSWAEPGVLKRDFYNSLCAAFTVNEIREQLSATGLGHLDVEKVSDRHVEVIGRR